MLNPPWDNHGSSRGYLRDGAGGQSAAGGRRSGPLRRRHSRARLVAVNGSTGVSTRIAADPRGFFVFLSLTPGEYTVTIEAPGFQQLVLTGVALSVATTIVETPRLEIGSVTESLTVEAGRRPSRLRSQRWG